MKAIKFTAIALITIFISARVAAQTETKDQQLVVPLSDPGKPYKLNVDLVNGSIKISTYEGKDVVIDVTTPEHKKAEDKNSGGMKRIPSGENVDVVAREKANQVNISTEMPGKDIILTIKIPQGATNIKLSTVNGKSIIGSNLSGALELSDINGFIQLTDVSGSVVANSINGKLLISFKSIDPKAAMAFSTLNGNIDVTFPAGLKANMKVRSDRGEVFTDFDIAADPSQPKVTKTAKDGMYHLNIEDWIYGKINGGGPEMMFKTMNGNILIRKAK
jgi:hypothetical protein